MIPNQHPLDRLRFRYWMRSTLSRLSKIVTEWQPLPSFWHAALILLLAAAGCSSSDLANRQAVSGTVTFDGQAIASGAILFEPVTLESGTAVGATIKNGTFAISRAQGAVPGLYRVRIYASSGVQALPAKDQSERAPRPMVERLPPQYNAKSELSTTVAPHSPNHIRFDLYSSRSADVR
jgi:hypothetical protein